MQVSGLPVQVHLSKIQLQELLLGFGLTIRDLDFVCFTEYEEVTLPPFLLGSCMETDDTRMIDATLNNFFHIIEEHVK